MEQKFGQTVFCNKAPHWERAGIIGTRGAIYEQVLHDQIDAFR